MAAASVLPLKHYADFSGRSTRTEVVGFYILTMISVFAAKLVAGWLGQDGTRPWLEAAVALVFVTPTLALFVRRLHDWGRSGWWLLIVSPLVLAGVSELIARPRPFTLHIDMHLPWWAMVPAVLSGLALWACLLWPDDLDGNRYGLNPRTGPMGEPA